MNPNGGSRVATGVQESPQVKQYELEQTAKSGAGWFYWIAGLSAVNSVAWWLNLNWAFAVGLGLTQVFDGLSSELGTGGLALALVVDVATVVLLVLVGRLALRYPAVYVAGIVFYVLDGALLVFLSDLLGAGFHLLALVFMGRGLRAARTLAAASPVEGAVPTTAPADVAPVLPAEPALAEDSAGSDSR